MINRQFLNSAVSGQAADATQRRNPDSSPSGLAKASRIQTLDWTQQSSHANSGPPHVLNVLKSLERDIMFAERVADLARRQLKQARGLGLHPARRLHRFQQTFPLCLRIPVQYAASV